jgi:hypothetical protein
MVMYRKMRNFRRQGRRCALCTHALWCWGYNDDGELGLGTTTDQHRPQLVTA